MSALESTTARGSQPEDAMASPRISRWQHLRWRIAARWGRLTMWEFWPATLVYLPLVVHIAWLAVKHIGRGGPVVCMLANPGIPLGGLVGESKWDILQLLPQESVIPTALLGPDDLETRCASLNRVLRERGWAYPLVLKPDVGERGNGVALVQNADAARRYMGGHKRAILVQEFDRGPFEAGVFYYRYPDQEQGRIFSITDKRFASVMGDGVSTIETLIRGHPRYRMQIGAYLEYLGDLAREVPTRGESVRIGFAGNHCRGAMFLDGAHLITPALERAFDQIAKRTNGFYFGRFDVRYSDEVEFAAGRGFRIVELNGLLSESTNIYDPSMRFWSAQRILRRQWTIAYEIGARNQEMRRRT